MAMPSLRKLLGGDSDADQSRPPIIDGGTIPSLQPWTAREGVREIRQYTVNPGRPRAASDEGRKRDVLSGSLLWVAGLVIAAALGGAAYVAYEAQRLFSLAHNGGDSTRAVITAALPDAGWIAMATVALVAALRGRSSARARVGVVLFFGMSLGAQLMYAERTPEGILVATIPPVTLAWMLESFVVEVRRWAAARRGLDLDESPVLSGFLRLPRLAGRLALWVARMFIAFKSTWGGLFDWIRDEAPLAPGRTAASLRAQAAIEQAGGVEQAAERARAEALAEAEEIKAAAQAEAEQARADAAEQIEQAMGEARAAIEQAQRENSEQIAAARQQAATDADRARSEAAEHANAMAEQAEQQVREVRQEAAEQIAQIRAETQRTLKGYDAELAETRKQHQATASELYALRAEHALLLKTSTGKARLIALYERLGQSGDPRYGDRERLAELARELYERAGLASEGTARNYLYEHVSDNSGAMNGAAI